MKTRGKKPAHQTQNKHGGYMKKNTLKARGNALETCEILAPQALQPSLQNPSQNGMQPTPQPRAQNEAQNSLQDGVNFFVHPTSIIEQPCKIGEGTKIWHFCHILPHTHIGARCSFGQNCVIGPGVFIGNGCKVQNNVSIYEGVSCEEDVFIGPSVVFSNVINPRAFINRRGEFLPTLLKKGCSIGANATIICGHSIGKYALIGAGAVVSRDVPDYALVVGNPARIIGWVDKTAQRLNFTQGRAWSQEEGCAYFLQDGRVKCGND